MRKEKKPKRDAARMGQSVRYETRQKTNSHLLFCKKVVRELTNLMVEHFLLIKKTQKQQNNFT